MNQIKDDNENLTVLTLNINIEELKKPKSALDKDLKLGHITKREYDLFWGYIINIKTENGKISVNRIKKIFSHLSCWRKFYGITKEYTKCKYEDLINVIFLLDYVNSTKGKPLSINTKTNYISILKGFFTYLVENGYSKIKKKKIKSIKVPQNDQNTIKIENIPNQRIIKKMINCAKSIRDQAWVYLMYEAGLRINEVSNLKWNQIQFFDDGSAELTVRSKTEYTRQIPILSSVNFLRRWMNIYPLFPDGQNYVFLTKNNKKMEEEGIRKQFTNILNWAEITANITPHCFRHARIIHMILQGTNESVIKKIMWGHEDTNELKVYLNITNSDVREAVFKMHGVGEPESCDKEKYVLESKRCSTCNYINSGLSKMCEKCNTPLEVYTASHLERFTALIEEKEEYCKLVEQILENIAAKINVNPS